ncbi:MAG: ATP-binding protein [Pseudomonadota bacterium]
MSLRAKLLAILIPFTALICLGVGWLLLRDAAFHEALVLQQNNRELARNLVKENILYDADGQLNPVALDNVFHTMMVINPAIEVYLLDPDGSVYMHSAPADATVSPAVDMAAVRAFLGPDPAWPLRGSDPRRPEAQVLFSVAPVAVDGQPRGYLYIVLAESAPAPLLTSATGQQTVQMLLLIIGGILLLAAVLGIAVMRLITHRIKRLDDAVAAFRRDLAEPSSVQPITVAPPGRGGSDEIDSVAAQTAQMSETIVHQLGKLASTDRLRRQLIANVSHDLRTPLTAVEGYLQTVLVKSDQLDAKTQRQYVETAYRSARRLRHLIVELFELSRLEAESRHITSEDFCIAELVSDVVQKLGLIAQKRGVTLDFQVDPEAAHARGEIGLIERALDNLIVNAIKHSPKHSTVTISLRPGGNGTVRVAVVDHGCGIAEQDLPYVFDRFYRPSTSGAQQTPGAGLGLAIVRRIIELHDSGIEARSELGSGSTFSFWLPSASPA